MKNKIKNWLLFKIAAGVLICVSVLVIAVLLQDFFSTYNNNIISVNPVEALFSAGAVFLFLVSIVFLCFCLMLIQKKYPDKGLSRTQKISFTVLLVLYFFPVILSIFVFLYGVNQTVTGLNQGFRQKPVMYIFLGFLFIIVAGFVYTLIAAIRLKKQIRLNFEASQLLEINNLGQQA